MNTLPLSLYDLVKYGLGGETFQSFVDHYEEKYEASTIDGFTIDPTQLGYTWQQLIASVKATVLPTYVDPESPGYEMPLNEVSGKTGNIPTMKNFYRLNRVVVREKLQLLQKLGSNAAILSNEMKDVFMGLLDEGTERLVQSYWNALKHQRDQIVSKGQFTINNINNPRGYGDVTIGFGIDATHFDTLTGQKRWWTDATHETEGTDADPIGYLKNRVKAIRRTYHYVGALSMEISQALWDDLVGHSKFLVEIGKRLSVTASVVKTDDDYIATAKYASDEALLEALRKMIRVDSIKVRDSYAYVAQVIADDEGVNDIVSVPVDNFDPKNISFIPEGNIGSIKGVEPISLGHKPEEVARHHGGRLLLEQRFEPKTHSIYIDSEAAQLCVLSVPQYTFISTVTA